MTNREFFTSIINGDITDEVVNFAKASIAALDTKNEKRKTSPSAIKAQTERDNFRALVLSILTDKLQTSAQITAQIGDPEISVAKVTAALTALVKSDMARVEEFKPNGKGRKVNGYALAVDTKGE